MVLVIFAHFLPIFRGVPGGSTANCTFCIVPPTCVLGPFGLRARAPADFGPSTCQPKSLSLLFIRHLHRRALSPTNSADAQPKC